MAATCEICGEQWIGLHCCPLTENEHQYLALLEKIVREGVRKENRTGVDTIGILGTQSRYDLNKGFPLFTTKKVFFKAIVHELLWFLSGDRNIKYLVDNGVNIWNGDAYRRYKEWFDYGPPLSEEDFIQAVKGGEEFENSKGWTLKAGDLGPCYGTQWKKWKYDYHVTTWDGHKVLGYKFFDQIENLVDGLKNNPDSRRHILSAWNVPLIGKMALPPCHVMSQYSVVDSVLHSHMYQRSMDTALGCPFNVASYALLTHMLAQVCGYKVGEFIHTAHDSHIYVNQIDGIKEQLNRQPYAAPKLWLNSEIKNIDDFKFEDIKIKNYKHHPKIFMPLSTDDIIKV